MKMPSVKTLMCAIALYRIANLWLTVRIAWVRLQIAFYRLHGIGR